MRNWFGLIIKGSTKDDMLIRGFVPNTMYKWWFHDILRVAVSFKDSEQHPFANIISFKQQYKINNDVLFYSSTKQNIDVLETIYSHQYKEK